ncbi:MFS transporter [Cellulosimicrobium funkei]|uniref:MFS transporter n=1 Tax=Cellulosimicrobium funkei TaxID=264251 RepID=UPI00368A1B14
MPGFFDHNLVDGYAGARTGTTSRRATCAAAVAQSSAYVPLAATVVVLLPMLVAVHSPEHKEQHLGWIAALSSILTAVSLPLLGLLSDRTRTPWGPRMPWILGGALVGGFAVAGMPWAPSLAVLAMLWITGQVALNAVDGGAAAVLSDDTDASRRGSSAALLGAATAVGSGIGVVVAGSANGNAHLVGGFAGAFAAAGGLAFAALRGRGAPRVSSDDRHRPGSLFVGLRTLAGHPRLRRVIASRISLLLGLHALTSYQVYILADHVGVPLATAAGLASLNAALFVGLSAIGGLVAGRWSDRSGHRTPFLIAACTSVALGIAIAGGRPTVATFLILTVLGGLGSGCFLTVQLAQSIDLLPSRANAGRDLGILGIATTATQAVAPLLTVALLALGAGYSPVFFAGACCASAAGLLQFPSRVAKAGSDARL